MRMQRLVQEFHKVRALTIFATGKVLMHIENTRSVLSQNVAWIDTFSRWVNLFCSTCLIIFKTSKNVTDKNK